MRAITRTSREFVMGIVIPTSSIETHRRLSVPRGIGEAEGASNNRAVSQAANTKILAPDYLYTNVARRSEEFMSLGLIFDYTTRDSREIHAVKIHCNSRSVQGDIKQYNVLRCK